MTALPLLVFDTNILMELLLGRDGANAVLLVQLAEQKRVEVVVPEYVLFEFRGTALRWIRDELERLSVVRRSANEWMRSQELDKPAEDMKSAASDLEAKLKGLQAEVDVVVARVRSVARVPQHTMDLHFRGDLRYLGGRPPDRPVDGLKDCRIYEAVLEIAKADQAAQRPKFLVTRDSDFDMKELVDELAALGFTIRKDPGGLYGQLRA
jgi:predicted nucleic acid-binding protein